MSFLSTTSYSETTTQQKQSFSWLSRNLHGIDFDIGNYPYIYLTQIIQSVRLRSPGAIFYAKGAEKVKFLSELLECPVIDLNSPECPSISVNYFTQNCQNHSNCKNKFNKNCAKEKTIFYFNWLTNERGFDKSGGNLVTEFNNLCLDYGARESESFNFQRQNHKIRKLQRKDKLLLTEDEICSFTHLVYFIEPFLQWRKQNVKKSTQSMSYKTLTDVEAPGWWGKWQKRSFTAKRDSTLSEGRKSAQNCFVYYKKTERLWVLYGSYERLSNWVHLLWVVLCELISKLYFLTRFYFLLRWRE